MSLQIWLPLTGDLHNQGLSNSIVINSGATVDNNGKIGKCYSLTNGNYLGLDANNINNHKYSPISCALWIYPTQNDSTERYILGCWQHGGCGFVLRNQKIAFYVYANGNTSCQTPTTVTLNTWHHICATYDESNIKLYLNGECVSTVVESGKITYDETCPWEIGGNPNSTSFANGNLIAKINDVRIYDHALSAKEVEEIAKGLILHYPLNDRFCEPTTNLVAQLVAGGRTTVTNNVVKNTGENADTFWYIKPKEALVGGSTYTVSCNCTGFSSNDTYISFKLDHAGTWKIYNGYNTFTFTMSSDLNGSTASFVFDDNGGTRTQIFEISNVQLEKKDHATPFVQYGTTRTPTTIFDISGYSNNGTIIGDLIAAAPSPRYEIATQFPGDSFIKKSDFHIGNIWTLSCWFYSPSSSTKAWSPLIICNNTGGDSDSKFSIYYNQTTGVVQFLANGTYDITQTTTKDTWHCIVATFDGSMLTGYIDGNQVMTKAISNAELHKTNLGIGTRCMGAAFSSYSVPFEGKISDVHIYSTALTAAQVKELYNTSMSVDSNGNVYARELSEL